MEVRIEDSILNSVKKQLGILPDMTEFDPDIIMNINSAISTLTQIGVGRNPHYVVTGPDDTYSDFLGFRSAEESMVKMYLYQKTKLGFDPPASASVAESLKAMIMETEYRLQIQAEEPSIFEDRGD